MASGGDLILGDSSTHAGFISDGELRTGAHTVTLHDANAANLGVLTTLGDGNTPGTLSVPNGAAVDFGYAVVGVGVLDTPNDLTKPLINNGDIAGNSPSELIELTGYVKGVGTLDNVNITGTDAPGFSTASVVRGSVTYGGTLEIEIGGTSPGSGYDQINHVLGTGTATMGGALDLNVTGSYIPALGDTFDVINFTTGSGHFGPVEGILLDGLGLGHLSLAVVYEEDAWLHPATGVDVRVSLSGDATLDDIVDVGDLAIVGFQWGVGDRWRFGDLNGDSIVDVGDLALVGFFWGNDVGNTSLGGAASVPLPGAGLAGLALLGGMGMARRRYPRDEISATTSDRATRTKITRKERSSS